LAVEDPDATLPYNPRCFSTLVPQELEVAETRGRSGITLVPQSRASIVESEAMDVSVATVKVKSALKSTDFSPSYRQK